MLKPDVRVFDDDGLRAAKIGADDRLVAVPGVAIEDREVLLLELITNAASATGALGDRRWVLGLKASSAATGACRSCTALCLDCWRLPSS
jgi:hypothetical protein